LRSPAPPAQDEQEQAEEHKREGSARRAVVAWSGSGDGCSASPARSGGWWPLAEGSCRRRAAATSGASLSAVHRMPHERQKADIPARCNSGASEPTLG